MTRLATAVAAAYGLPEAEVASWSARTVAVFYAVAVRRGWLHLEPITENRKPS